MGRTLIRWVRWVIALAGLCAIAFIVMLVAARQDRATRPFRRGDEWQVGIDPPVKQYVPPTAEEMRTYLLIVGDIVTAYSNGQEKAMYEAVACFPKSVYDLRDGDHHKVVLPLNQAWYHDWIRFRKDGLKEYASAEDFERTMRVSMAMARIYGRFIVDSGLTADNTIVSIECGTLERLQKYKDKFAREGRSDCLQATERLFAEWVEQIESENGFTRVYIRRQDKAGKYFVERGETTAEKMRRCVRGGVYPLQKLCGYTPKWLDEEFPLLPEDGNGNGQVEHGCVGGGGVR